MPVSVILISVIIELTAKDRQLKIIAYKSISYQGHETYEFYAIINWTAT